MTTDAKSAWSKALIQVGPLFVAVGIPLVSFFFHLSGQSKVQAAEIRALAQQSAAQHVLVIDKLNAMDERLRANEQGLARLQGRME